MQTGVNRKRIGTREQLDRALNAIVAQGGEVAFAAANLATGEETGRNAERSMPTASVFKLPLLVEVYRQVAAGDLDLDSRVTLRAEDVVKKAEKALGDLRERRDTAVSEYQRARLRAHE